MTAIRHRRIRVRRRWDDPWIDVVVAALVPLALFGATGFLDPPATVARLTITNPTDYDLSVAVGTDDGTPGNDADTDVVRLLTVLHGRTASTDHVPDQGDTWRIELRSQGVEADPIVLTRDQLEAADWQVSVPDAVADQLAERGAPPID